MADYYIRKVCKPVSEAWHYFYLTQVSAVDETVDCPTHPTADTRDFVVLDKS